jgi:hypothetical protein
MMRTLITAIIFILFLNTITYAQINYTKKPEKVKTNSWAAGILYAENGFGLFGTYSKILGRTTSTMFRLSISGVSDPNEVQYYDYYGNSYVRDKINRVYDATLSIGLKHNIFFDDIDGNFKPYIKGGIAPTLILMTPYDRSFFPSFGYAQTSYGIGVFGGVGLDYYESKSLGMGLGIEYSYIPVLGNEVRSILDHNITNVGGLQFCFNIMFF